MAHGSESNMHDLVIQAEIVTLLALVTLIVSLKHKTRNAENRLQPIDLAVLNQARIQTRRLEGRMDQPNRILDHDVPGWRTRS